MKFFMNGLNSTNNTFRFLSEHACMNRGSTVGKNLNDIMWKYEVPRKMCRGSYVAISKLITKSYKNTIKTDDATHASIIAECIKIRDTTMTCETMQQCDANDIVMYLTNMYCITLYFRGRKISRKVNLKYFREKIFSRIYCSRENIFPRKYLPAKISSRENILSRKYLPAKISSRENISPRGYAV